MTTSANPTETASKVLTLVEEAKRAAAIQAVAEHFSPEHTYVGIGSGSTIKYVVDAIKDECVKAGNPRILFVPTGYQSRTVVDNAGLTAINFDSLAPEQMLDVAFDGADECDEEMNLIKGGGACLFQEKLVATRAKKFICVADFRKDVSRLLTTWSYIPVEVAPIAVKTVMSGLRAIGCPNPTLRPLTSEKEGPLKTDQDFYIIMAPFPPLLTYKDPAPAPVMHGGSDAKTIDGQKGRIWEAGKLATAIKMISGVLEVGLFVGVNGPEAMKMGGQGGQKPVAVYFGLEDGSVKVRRAPGIDVQ